MGKAVKKVNKHIVLVKKSNNLIESRYKFDIWETRVFLCVLSKIRREDENFKTYRIWYKDLIKIFDIKSGDGYSLLRNATKSLMQKTCTVNYEQDGVVRERMYHLLREADYVKEGQESKDIESHEYIEVTIEDKMKPFLLQLQRNFTAYDLRNIVRLGVYSVRVYELLKQYESIGRRTLEVEDMKKMFEVTKQYKQFYDFFKWVVEPAVKEINEHTDIYVEQVEKIKEGRSVKALFFRFRTKTEQEIRKTREVFENAKQLPLFPQEEIEKYEPEDDNEGVDESEQTTLVEEHFAWLNEWWGLERDEFVKRAEGKTQTDIEQAIAFTKARIKLGKAENPAGVFLDALAKGHKTAEQHKSERRQKKEKELMDKKERLEPLVIQYKAVKEQEAKAINEAIRSMTEKDPTLTDQAIETIKRMYANLGTGNLQNKGVDEFRKNPLLRGLVKNELMKQDPDRFKSIQDGFAKQIEELQAQIQNIEPKFAF